MIDRTFNNTDMFTFDDADNAIPIAADDMPREILSVNGQTPTYHQLAFNVARSIVENHTLVKGSHFQITASAESDIAERIGDDPVVFLVQYIREDSPRIPENESEIIAQSIAPAFLTPLG